MKIAIFVGFFFPYSIYGTETYTLNLAKQLRLMGHDTVVITAHANRESDNKEVLSTYVYEEIPVYCINSNYFPKERMKDTYYLPQMRGLYRDLLATINPDIIHVTHINNHSCVLLEIAVDNKIPMVCTFTDFFGICYKSTLEGADGSLCKGPDRDKLNCLLCYSKQIVSNRDENSAVNILVKKCPWLLNYKYAFLEYFNRVTGLYKYTVMRVRDIKDRPEDLLRYNSLYDAVIAPTKFLRNTYIANGLKVPIHLIHFGVDLSRTAKMPPGNQFPVRFGFIGQIARHKGTDILIDAFRRLPKGKAELYVYGKMNDKIPYSEELRKSSEGYAVFFKGTFPSDKINEVLNSIDILVIPSIWYENSPLVLLNSLASHTPVIISDVEGMTEFVDEGRNGYVFKMGSVDELEKVLRRVIDNPEKSRAMFKTTEYPRTNEMMVKDVLSVYESVMSKGNC